MIIEEPIWREGDRPAEFPRVTGNVRVDVAVVGGGFAGLSAASHVLDRRPGSRVAVLEADRIGAGASGGTTGMLGPGVGQSLPALVRRHGPARARALYAATLGAVEDVRRLVERNRIDCELEMTGQLMLARGPAGRARVATVARLLGELELPGEVLDDDELDRTIHLDPPRPHGTGFAALRLPVAGTLHPRRLLRGLAECVVRRGGTIHEQARVLRLEGRRPVVLELGHGTSVVADDVVLATAGYTPTLGVLRGRLLPVHLQVIATAPLAPNAREMLGWKGREGVLDSRRVFNYFRQTCDGRIVFGGGRPRYHWGGSVEPRAARARALDQLILELEQTFGRNLGLRVTHGWSGVIGYVVDALPAIQRASRMPSVLHVVGWCGHGVALSLASGAWVASMLCDGAVGQDLPWFRDRPPLLPFEIVRWAGFRTTVRAMSLLDRVGRGPR